MKTIAVLFILSGACDGVDIPDRCWGAWNTNAPISMERPANINNPQQRETIDHEDSNSA